MGKTVAMNSQHCKPLGQERSFCRLFEPWQRRVHHHSKHRGKVLGVQKNTHFLAVSRMKYTFKIFPTKMRLKHMYFSLI